MDRKRKEIWQIIRRSEVEKDQNFHRSDSEIYLNKSKIVKSFLPKESITSHQSMDKTKTSDITLGPIAPRQPYIFAPSQHFQSTNHGDYKYYDEYFSFELPDQHEQFLKCCNLAKCKLPPVQRRVVETHRKTGKSSRQSTLAGSTIVPSIARSRLSHPEE